MIWKNKYFLAFVCLSLPLIAIGQTMPVTLSCSMEGFDRVQTMTVDLDNKFILWGDSTYKIVHVSPNYLTATDDQIRPGGGVMVLDRNSGMLKTTLIALFASDDKEPQSQPRLIAHTNTGHCTKPVL